MERTGWLHLLIALFASIGSLLTGGRGAPVQQASAAEAPIVRMMVTPKGGALSEEEVDAAIETLRLRFPGAEVKAERPDEAAPPTITIEGDLEGNDETLEQLATSAGGMRMLMTAYGEDAKELSVDLDKERERVEAFLAADGTRGVDDYNALLPGEGGSPERLVFAMQRQEGGSSAVALVVESEAKWRFDESAISRTFISSDHNRRPALGFDVHPDRQKDFEAFTAQHEGQQLALLVGDRILTRPNLNSPLRTGGIITGGGHGFGHGEVDSLHRILSAPKLRSKLVVSQISRESGR